MSLFGAINISATGIDAAQTWLNTTAGNLANQNDVVATSSGAYATQTPVFSPVGQLGQVGDGVQVSGIDLGDSYGLVEQDPTSPLADKNGNVRVPDVDTSYQLVSMISAQEDYQANAAAIAHATTAYQSALGLGK